MGRSKPIWDRTVALTTTPSVVYLPDTYREVKIFVDALSYAQLGTTYAAPAVADVSGVTSLIEVGAPTGGTITLVVFPNDVERAVTGTIAYNASAATIKTALTTTNKFVAGDITAAGGTLDTAAVTLTWTGVYAVTVPTIVLGTNALTGGVAGATVNARVTTLPLGHGGYGYIEANTQETWENDNYGDLDRYVYLATVASTGTARITAYN
jgi:hypothetical protein